MEDQLENKLYAPPLILPHSEKPKSDEEHAHGMGGGLVQLLGYGKQDALLNCT